MKILYTNAKIFTSDEKIPWAKEMLVNDEVIEYIGEVRNHTKCDEIIDCGGKMILPGFIDSHCHLQMIAESSWHIILPPFDKVEDILAFVKDYADKHSKEEVPFLYFDYYMTELFDKNGPTKEMLDEIVSDRPVCLTDFTEHMNWVNSKMLELMEVDKNTPDPDNLHVFWRDKQGNPTGWIKERAWEPHIGKLYENIGWWPPSPTNKEVQLNMFSKMIDYGYQAGFNAFMIGEEDMSSVYELDKEEKLNFYYDVSYRCDDLNKLSDAIELVKELNRKYQSKHQKINTIKLFMDGTMASGNAALLEPLCNDPGNYGVAALDENEIELYLHTCNEADIDVHIHVLGDRTFRMICNAVENLKAELGDRWRIQVVIAHACLVAKEDRKRPAELGISINATPHWNGGMYGESALEVIGRERFNQQSAYVEFVESGAQIAFSSDTTSMYEFNRSNPFLGIQVGHTRVDPQYPMDPDKYEDSIMPMAEQKISLDALLKGFTIEGAKQMHWEDKIGSLKKGKMANFIVLSENIFEVPKDKIIDINVLASVFEGKLIKGNL